MLYKLQYGNTCANKPSKHYSSKLTSKQLNHNNNNYTDDVNELQREHQRQVALNAQTVNQQTTTTKIRELLVKIKMKNLKTYI